MSSCIASSCRCSEVCSQKSAHGGLRSTGKWNGAWLSPCIFVDAICRKGKYQDKWICAIWVSRLEVRTLLELMWQDEGPSPLHCSATLLTQVLWLTDINHCHRQLSVQCVPFPEAPGRTNVCVYTRNTASPTVCIGLQIFCHQLDCCPPIIIPNLTKAL